MKYVYLVLALGLLSGCSHSMIMKDCKQVESEEMYVCKTMKPWE